MTKPGGKRKEPDIIYTKNFLNSPGTEQELREILLWWEMSLARQVLERLKAEQKAARHG